MKTHLCTVAAAVIALCGAAAASGEAVDLTKIDRTIATEPAYKSGKPAYCLVVFGEKAQTRIWLVLDGNDLYVDLNGDGDLTGEGERIAPSSDGYNRGGGTFSIAEIREVVRDGEERDRPVTHKNFTLNTYEYEGQRMTWLSIETNGARRQFASAKFADKASEAPIVHLNGPLQARLSERPNFTLSRTRPTEVYVQIGTPGLGEDTFASISYAGIPATFKPRLEIAYPSGEGSESPVMEVLILPGRC